MGNCSFAEEASVQISSSTFQYSGSDVVVLSDENSSSSSYSNSNPIHKGGVLDLLSIPGEVEKYVSCSNDNTICVFDWKSYRASDREGRVKVLKGHTKAVNRVGMSALRSNEVWSASRDLGVKQWDIDTGICKQSIDSAHTLNISSIAVNYDGSSVITGSRDYSVKVWDAETLQTTSEFKQPRNVVTCLSVDRTTASDLIYQGSEDLCVRVWDMRESQGQGQGQGHGGKPAQVLGGYVYFPVSMDISSGGGGHYLATGCKGFDGLGSDVKIWDLRHVGKGPMHSVNGHSMDVTGVKFITSQESECILSCSKDGTAMVTRASDGKRNKLITPGDRNLTCLAIGGQKAGGDKNKISASCGTIDGTIYQWSIKLSLTPDANDSTVSVEFTAGGGSSEWTTDM